jgi:L-iditol 2-dehydrogenase
MKAAVLYGNEDIRYDDYETPVAGPGTVKIAVKASGICGSDIPRVLHKGAHYYPIVLGHEFAGEVVEVGEGVTKVKVGDTVTGAPRIPCFVCEDCLAGNIAQCTHDSFIGSRQQGSFAEYVVIPEANAVPYDPSVPYDVAVFFEPATVAAHGLMQNDYSGGEYVAVIGSGTIGLFVLQWAKIFGSRRVVVFDVDDDRLALAKKFGADEVVNSLSEGYIEKAKALTGGAGYAQVFEAVGNNVTLLMALELAAAKAKVGLIGTPHDTVSFTKAQWEIINRKELTLRGSWQGYSLPFPGREWELAAHYFATGQLRADPSFIDRAYPLSEAAEAFARFKNPQDVHGKILLVNK